MANENKASYFCIGLVVLMGLLGITGTLVYIGGLRGRGDKVLVETYYDKHVGGLSAGSAVNFRGVKIGEVREVGFIGCKYDVDGLDNSRIYILMALDKDKMGESGEETLRLEDGLRNLVERGLRAMVSVNSITGIAKVECEYYPLESDDGWRNLSWTPKHVLIPPKVSLLESFSESATKVMNQINRMDLNAFWSNINASVESVSAMTLSTRHLLESYQPEVERMFKNLEEASASLRVFADTVRDNPAVLFRGRTAERLSETER